MNPLLIGPIFEIGKTILERFVPDPEKKAAAEMELIRMAADGELKQVIAQLEINAREAAHPSLLVAGWRPYFGWVGGTGFAYAVLLQPLCAWVAMVKGWPQPPTLDTDLLLTVGGGMLGIGGLRTYEKQKGVTR